MTARHIPDNDETRLIVPRSPRTGNWIGLISLTAGGIACAYFSHWWAADVLWLLALGSFLTPVSYWDFDKSAGTLTERACNGLRECRGGETYQLDEIAGIHLKITHDGEGGRAYRISAVTLKGKTIIVSTQKGDADAIANFLSVEKIIDEIE